ncbi:MAG: hypothetical protein WC451_00730 [Patescibacteria group bacterium]
MTKTSTLRVGQFVLAEIMEGFPVDVYEGETLVIAEPVASRLLNRLRL